MTSNTITSKTQGNTVEHVTETKAFYVHTVAAVITIALLYAINFMVSPWYLWATWALVGWGFTLMIHGGTVLIKHGAFARLEKLTETPRQITETNAFYMHLFSSIGSVILLFVVNYMTSPFYLWAMWALIGWSFALTAHGITIFAKYGGFSRLKLISPNL